MPPGHDIDPLELGKTLGRIESGVSETQRQVTTLRDENRLAHSEIFDRLGKVEQCAATMGEQGRNHAQRIGRLEGQPRRSMAKVGGLGVVVSGIVVGVIEGIKAVVAKHLSTGGGQ